jgi:hypothetical protein
VSHFGVFYPRGGGRYLIEIIYSISLIIPVKKQLKPPILLIIFKKLEIGTGRGLSEAGVASGVSIKSIPQSPQSPHHCRLTTVDCFSRVSLLVPRTSLLSFDFRLSTFDFRLMTDDCRLPTVIIHHYFKAYCISENSSFSSFTAFSLPKVQ